METVEILGIPLQRTTMGAALEKAAEFVAAKKPHLIATANPEMIMLAQEDLLLAEILKRADLVVADGIGAVWASRILRQPLPERIPGIELAEGLLRLAAEKGWRVFFLGAEKGVADKAARQLRQKYPALPIVGTHHGFFHTAPENKAVLEKIRKSRPQILLAGLGVPRQEKWLAANLGTLEIPLGIGIGGSFNVWAGTVKRAPLWLRQLHLEWFYRLIKQPWRIKRLAVLPEFVFKVWAERCRQGGKIS